MKDRQQRLTSNLNTDLDVDIAKTVLKKNLIYVPIIILIGLSLAFIYLRYTKPLYESSAVIQRITKDEGKRVLDIEGFSQESNLSEDVELLRSSYLIEKALKNLNLNVSYFAEGDILTEEKYLHSPYHITLLELKDSSMINKKIFLKKFDKNKNIITIKPENHPIFSLTPGEDFENEFFRVILKITDKNRFIDELNDNELFFIINDYTLLANKLHNNLGVFIENIEAKTINISFRSNNSLLATDMVKSIIETFFQYDIDKKSESSANVLKFIDGQLDTVFNQLKISEIDIQSFKDDNHSKDPGLVLSNINSQLTVLQNQLLQEDLEFEMLKDIDLGVNSRDRVEVYNLIPVIAGTRFQNILSSQLEKLHELLEEREDISYAMTNQNDNIKKLDINIDIQIQTINRTIKSIKKQIKNKIDALRRKISELESQLYGVPAKEMELSRLKRKFNLNEKYYSLLIEKRTQYEISKAGFTMDNIILSQPSNSQLISPNKKFIYISIFILSVIVSILFLIIRYITFNVIHNENELKNIVPENVGFLGVISNVKTDESNSTLVVHKRPKSIISETLRNIRTNLQFVLDSSKSNLIAISSSISGEGKTFVAINLGGIFAVAGKKVIVIDLDLRKPKIHLGFNSNNSTGMSSILARKSNWQDCIQHSELEGLDYICAGTIPPNPSELIINGELDKVVEELKNHYDLVIIDNPPVGIVSDGIKVLNSADCAIYVFRANYSKRLFANRVRELLSKNKVKDLYMVLNDVDLGKYSYGYGYGYGYGGGYYEDNSIKEVKKKKSLLRKIFKIFKRK